MTGALSRRRVFSFLGIGAIAGVGGCAHAVAAVSADLVATTPSPGPVTVRVGQRLRLHMFQTGWVAVKEEHKAFAGPAALRFPAIMASRSWTDWLPVTAFVIEHPDGLFVVDTGETADIMHPDYAACDPATGMFYRRNLRFSLGAQDELGPQMQRAGLDPDRVEKVIMTHLHSDHMGGHAPLSACIVLGAGSGVSRTYRSTFVPDPIEPEHSSRLDNRRACGGIRCERSGDPGWSDFDRSDAGARPGASIGHRS